MLEQKNYSFSPGWQVFFFLHFENENKITAFHKICVEVLNGLDRVIEAIKINVRFLWIWIIINFVSSKSCPSLIMLILVWNICGFSSHKHDLHHFISHAPKLPCLQETFLTCPLSPVPRYQFFSSTYSISEWRGEWMVCG